MYRILANALLAIAASSELAISQALVDDRPPIGRKIEGRVEVVDGDTIKLAHENRKTERIRLFGIDSVESYQTCLTEFGTSWECGAWVIDEVKRRWGGKAASCEVLGRDDSNESRRLVARCFVDGEDIARMAVRDGLAYADERFSPDYVEEEIGAALVDRGLHTAIVTNPQWVRETQAEGRIALNPACNIKGNIREGQRIFHSPGQRDYERTGIKPNTEERWFCTAQEARDAGWRAAKR